MDDLRTINEQGNTYGLLMAIERSTFRGPNGGAYWLCLCECGNTKTVRGVALRAGQNISCGCRAKLPRGQAALNNLYGLTKRNAIKGGKEWELSKTKFAELTKQNCTYCGVKPEQKHGFSYLNGYYFYNGLDRIDSSLGYTIENVVPCCGNCNRAKNTLSVSEFIGLIRRIYNYTLE